jgi:hypothetical protein
VPVFQGLSAALDSRVVPWVVLPRASPAQDRAAAVAIAPIAPIASIASIASIAFGV